MSSLPPISRSRSLTASPLLDFVSHWQFLIVIGSVSSKNYVKLVFLGLRKRSMSSCIQKFCALRYCIFRLCRSKLKVDQFDSVDKLLSSINTPINKSESVFDLTQYVFRNLEIDAVKREFEFMTVDEHLVRSTSISLDEKYQNSFAKTLFKRLDKVSNVFKCKFINK